MYLFVFLDVISSSIAKLRSFLAKLEDSTAELTKVCIASEWRIREHCDSLRQQVDIARETALESIHKASNTLMSEIDAYERGCLSSWTEAKESTENSVKDVSKRMREFVAEQHAFLQSLQASDTVSFRKGQLKGKITKQKRFTMVYKIPKKSGCFICCLSCSYFKTVLVHHIFKISRTEKTS